MVGTPGIYLYSAAGADSFAANDTVAADSAGSYTYTIDVSPGDNFTLTGNFGNDLSSADGLSDNGNGEYAASGQPSFGTFSLNSTNGDFSFTFTAADLLANGGWNQTISFTVSGTDFNGNTDTDTINIVVTCFAAGTRIDTPDGPRSVETLAPGDLVLAADGSHRKVRFNFRQTVTPRFGPAERLMPVRFAAGSLGPNVPHSDLTVTTDHAMLVDGVLCNAGALVNGTTITRVPLALMGDSYTVYHIETEAHEIILANGAPAETYIDNVGRQTFDNFAEFDAMYGDVPEMVELPLPRAQSARQVPTAIKARLAGQHAA